MAGRHSVHCAPQVFARLVCEFGRRGGRIRGQIDGRRRVVELGDMKRLSDEIRGEQLVLLCRGHGLLCLRGSLSLRRAHVHLPKLLVERIGILGWRLSIRRCWCSIRRRWGSVRGRRRSVSRRCWCSSICWRWRHSIAWSNGRNTYPSLTARVGSKLVCCARITVLLLAVRHSESSVYSGRV
jgi:hypothetical protein